MGKGGGGSSQPAPTSQTVSNTSIPSYAQPYVENMLGQTAALTDINQNPYQQYGGQRIAGFSPLQTQAMGNISNMQIAPQLGEATGLSGAAGKGSLGVSGQMMNVGQNYARMATDPSSIQAYMNPYIQQSLAPQLALLNQQQALGGQEIAAKAVGQGAFGGNRATLAQGLNAQNYDLARQQAIGQGYNQAFNQAQQAQQFGANLGLQGYQGALAGLGQANQAAATLGQLGQTQYGQQMGINQAQMQAGALQQALQQQGLDVAYQDFLKERNYPYQQVAFMSDMLRGLPLSQSAQTQYSAPPSFGSQLGGLGMTGLGIYGMSGGFRGAKEGGLMAAKAYKEGGQVGYSIGGDIKMMTTKQLQELLNNPTLTPMEQSVIEDQLMLRARMENNPKTSEIMGGGLDTIPSGEMFNAAGGGIVAFAGSTDGSLVKSKVSPKIENYQSWLENQIRSSIENQDKVNPFEKSEALQAEYAKGIKERQEQRPWETLAALGIGTLAGKSPYALSNLGEGGVYAMQQMQKGQAEDAADRKLMLQQAVEQEKSKYARDTGKIGTMQTALGQMYSREIGRLNAGAAGASAQFARAQNVYNSAVKDARDTLIDQAKIPGSDAYKKYRKDPAALERDAIANARKEVGDPILDTLGLLRPKANTATSTPGATTTGSNVPALPSGFVLQ